MPPTPSDSTRAVAESIRVQLGTDALVLITPGPRSCAVVIASVPGYPAALPTPDGTGQRTGSKPGRLNGSPTLFPKLSGRSGSPGS